VLRLLLVIRVAQQPGFTLTEIRTLLHGFSPDILPLAEVA
jgi:DNA-binding transcriptional MerR regulator